MTAPVTFLAATDFSDHARHAAERAARLARETGAALTLIHVVPGGALQELRRWLGPGHAAEQQVQDDARRQLEALAAELAAAHRIHVATASDRGQVLDAIGAATARLDAELLVLGARGSGQLRHVVLGSTAERLLRRTTRPLLVVRRAPHAPYRHALVALDFSPWSTRAVALARRVAPHARLSLLNAFQVPFEDKLRFAGVDEATIAHYRQQARADASQHVHAVAAEAGLRRGDWEACIVEGDASQRIVAHEREHGCDLVVLGKHGQSAAEDLLLGSVTKHVLAEGHADALVSTARDA